MLNRRQTWNVATELVQLATRLVRADQVELQHDVAYDMQALALAVLGEANEELLDAAPSPTHRRS